MPWDMLIWTQVYTHSQHIIHAMGHAHMDTGIYIVSTQYMPWDMLIWTQVYTHSQHTIHAMGHAHMDTGILILSAHTTCHGTCSYGHRYIHIVSTQYMPWDMLIWTHVYTHIQHTIHAMEHAHMDTGIYT